MLIWSWQDTLSTLFSLYIQDLGPGVEFGDTNWLGRQGIALALHSVADVLGSKDLPVVMTFLISRALVSFSPLVHVHLIICMPISTLDVWCLLPLIYRLILIWMFAVE